MDGSSDLALAVMLRSPKGVDKQVFLLMFAEYLAERGHNVMYITEKLSHIPPPLHGLSRKADAFARIHFRYLKNQTQLFDTLFDSKFYDKLLKTPHTIILDGLENYCENPDLKDISKVSASLLGATPNNLITPNTPRLVSSLTYDPNTVTPATLACCALFYPLVWDLERDSSGTVSLKGPKGWGNGATMVQFDSEEITSPFGEQQLLKLKKVMHTTL